MSLFTLLPKIRFVSTFLQLGVVVAGPCKNGSENKFIHAKNSPNRINIFVYEFIYGPVKGGDCRREHKTMFTLMYYNSTKQQEKVMFHVEHVLQLE